MGGEKEGGWKGVGSVDRESRWRGQLAIFCEHQLKLMRTGIQTSPWRAREPSV